MKIRCATKSDVAAIYAVDPVAAEEGSRRQHIRNLVEAGQAIVALIDEVVVGYAALEYTFFSNGFISMLMVDRASTRKGIATALLKHLEKMCKTDKLFTSTNESNKPMQGLMQSMSYEPSGTVYNLDEGDPELFYVKRLKEPANQSLQRTRATHEPRGPRRRARPLDRRGGRDANVR